MPSFTCVSQKTFHSDRNVHRTFLSDAKARTFLPDAKARTFLSDAKARTVFCILRRAIVRRTMAKRLCYCAR